MKLTSNQIESMAPNAAAAKNGRDLVAKGKFSELCTDEEGSLFWGNCAGSGKVPYNCSADFTQPSTPVFRCSCPSRQFPCKHCIGLLYALEKALPFAPCPIPEDLAAKREKLEKRQEKKIQEKESAKESLKEKAAKPKTVNAGAVVKKAEAQLTGIDMAAKLLANVVTTGLSSMDAREMKSFNERVKELGNYYIPGIQTAFANLALELASVQGEEYTRAIDQINVIAALLKKAAAHVQARKGDPAMPLEITSSIEEQIGYIWKLVELVERGQFEENAELAQLSFTCVTDPARREFVDEGAWISLKTGRIFTTRNHRPFKALKHIKEENSRADVALLRELYVYPGDLNPRVRWEPEALSSRPLSPEDLERIRSFAVADYAELVKTVKNSIKSPLADKHPMALIALEKAWMAEENTTGRESAEAATSGCLVLEDAAGNMISLRDIPGTAGTGHGSAILLRLLLPGNVKGLCLLVRMHNDVASGLFSAQPMSLVTDDKIIRLFY